jgi:N-acetylmuramate 1-kinase
MSPPNLHRALAKLYGEPLPPIRVVKLRGDASTRSYYRVHAEGSASGLPPSVIVMRLPDDALRSDEGGAQPSIHRLPFVEVAELLQSKGLPVPGIFVEDLDNGILLLEDLGDTTFEQGLRGVPSSEREGMYARAIDLLVDLHERCGDLPVGSIVSRRRFDRGLLQWELEHFREWGLEALWGPLDGEQSQTLSGAFSEIVLEIEAMPYGFVHRDYQSKNLMLGPGGALTLIDFQDALLGPRTYDIVALLCDSYVSIALELQESMIERYAALRRIEAATLRREFWLVALHRKLKDAGRFIFIDRVRKNPDFLQSYPQSMVYVGRAAAQAAGFEPLADVLERKIPGFPDEVQNPSSSVE